MKRLLIALALLPAVWFVYDGLLNTFIGFLDGVIDLMTFIENSDTALNIITSIILALPVLLAGYIIYRFIKWFRGKRR